MNEILQLCKDDCSEYNIMFLMIANTECKNSKYHTNYALYTQKVHQLNLLCNSIIIIIYLDIKMFRHLTWHKYIVNIV